MIVSTKQNRLVVTATRAELYIVATYWLNRPHLGDRLRAIRSVLGEKNLECLAQDADSVPALGASYLLRYSPSKESSLCHDIELTLEEAWYLVGVHEDYLGELESELDQVRTRLRAVAANAEVTGDPMVARVA